MLTHVPAVLSLMRLTHSLSLSLPFVFPSLACLSFFISCIFGTFFVLWRLAGGEIMLADVDVGGGDVGGVDAVPEDTIVLPCRDPV